uniref:Uncharacterized protein n=1 Tax=Cacopsylla melanoneura TaxID=428564 RepID=A0A8D8ZCZ3_9HEMI
MRCLPMMLYVLSISASKSCTYLSKTALLFKGKISRAIDLASAFMLLLWCMVLILLNMVLFSSFSLAIVWSRSAIILFCSASSASSRVLLMRESSPVDWFSSPPCVLNSR